VPELIYLKYEALDDMLKVMIYSAQSMIGVFPMLYYINFGGNHVLFIQTMSIGNATIHYIVQQTVPPKMFIELKRLSGEYAYVEGIGTDSQSLYVSVLKLARSTLEFPL